MYRLLHTGPHAPLTTMQYIQTQPPAMIITADGKDLANHLHVTTPAFAEGSYGKIYKGFLFQDAQENLPCVVKLSKVLLNTGAIAVNENTHRLVSHLQHPTEAQKKELRDLADEIRYATRLLLGPKQLELGIDHSNTRIEGEAWKDAQREELALQTHPGYQYIHHIYDYNEDYIPCLISQPCDGTLLQLAAPYKFSTDKDGSPTPLWLDSLHQIYLGLTYMHSLNVAHNDIKPENILFIKRNSTAIHCFVSDFGLSSEAHTLLNYVSGTPTYFSPELQALKKAKDQSTHGSTDPISNDAFAFAKTCLVLLCLRGPNDDDAALQKVEEHWIGGNDPVPAQAAVLLDICRAENGDKRKALFQNPSLFPPSS